MQMGGPELMVVLVVVALLFGPSRITGVARSLGESIHEFQAGQRAAETESRPDRRDQA
jgi:sec-independent protein translocase protein TatA